MASHLCRSGQTSAIARVLPTVCLAMGLLVVVVPLAIRLATDWRNARAVSAMSGAAQQMDGNVRTALLANAHAYNDVLAGVDFAVDGAAAGVSEDSVLPYEEQLDGGSSAISWMEVPKIGLRLLIYRGTESETLAAGVGHLEGSSLPVGGASTHCVLTGHSGLATSRMFDDIRRLEVGDVFYLHTLGQTLAYQVYGTEVVWPDEVSSLGIEQGKDLVTLVTCTPYGVNDHRLLVHAQRCEEDAEPTNQGLGEDHTDVVPGIGIATLMIGGGIALLATVLVARRRCGRG